MLKNAAKLGPILKMRLLEESPAGQISLLVRISTEPTNVLRDQLRDLGAVIRTEAGDILTITLPAARIDGLTALNTVVFAELSTALSPEGSTSPEA